ncbi:MAG: TolC family outer membrane protein [Ramlibacter sp.]|jgi:outer membrane protein|uniref:TolC family outer membrane protein n=1 Tax=Ramlibacter sp. TaxID=1917967 RepID=UPI00262101C7|nr:TolC family outer membrane protein [Ramlibacter sp.]MDH4377795.1 TolC family outer membrane protein [Ramlibacter sp.]
MTQLTRHALRLLPLAMAAAFAAPAQAQSLSALYESARGQDAAWQSARANFESVKARAEQARAGLLPSVSATAGATTSLYENVPKTGSSTSRNFDSANAAISVTHPLYRPANKITFEQGQKQVEAAQAVLQAAAQDLIIRVSQAYFDVLAAQDTLTFVRAQKTAVNEQLASARRNFEVGTATITDTREAQSRFDLVSAQELAAENDLRVKRIALDTVTGVNDAKPLALALPTAMPQPVPADPEAWVQQAEQTSTGIAQLRQALEVARLEAQKANTGHLPTLDMTASRSLSRSLGGSATSTSTSTTHNTQLGVSLSIPIYSGLSVQNRIREAMALEEKAKADLEKARRDTGQSVRTAYFSVVSGGSQVRALEAAETSSQSALDANRLGYQVGVRINIDVLNSQSQLFQTKRDLSVARYNVLMGNLKLRQVAGNLQAEDLTNISGLMVKP